MKNSYIIMNAYGKFAQLRGKSIVWVNEYPDATTWNSESAARRSIQVLLSTPHCNIYNIIANYGTEQAVPVYRFDALEQKRF